MNEVTPKLDAFTRAYIETALWSSTDESTPNGGHPMDMDVPGVRRAYTMGDIDLETLFKMAEDCAKFQADNAADLEAGPLRYGPDFGPDGRAGHDFWLSRNGHGANYLDGDWPDEAAERLMKSARAFGEFNLYVGDDGRIHGVKG